MLLCQRINQKREILVNKIHHSKKQKHGYSSYTFLITAEISGPFVIFVTETALQMLSRHICLILRLSEIAIFLSTLLCLGIVETRLVVESSYLLSAEKAEIE